MKTAKFKEPRLVRGVLVRKVKGYVCVWSDGSELCCASKSCAELKSAQTESPAQRIVTLSFELPESLDVDCPVCGIPWGDCEPVERSS